MKFEQRVQVRILGAQRPYSYSWWFEPAAGVMPLQVGDRVELPPNQVQEEGSSGTVVAVGTSYKGELKSIVRKIEDAYEREDDLWAGFGEGDYV
ncbi:hypothetical protein [Streptomyces roseolus]|uniref:hypothetical protein n=1 Tax=Streptomyces roseolus TaxID=67358 RepID=UPI001678F82C|nr:hypothetical protein [Streptomyces roseolus]GGR51484.1 hypothetical protein GCM10010282_50490 [Streptomyces roseolus]